MKSCTNVDEVRVYLAIFPKGRHVAEARACLKKLQLADDRAVMDDAFWNAVTSCAAHEAAGRLEAALDCLKKLQLADDAFWNTVKSCTNVDEVSLYLAIFPKGRHVAEARTCLKKLQLADDRAVMDDAFWNAVTSCPNVDEVSLYLEKFSKGRHVAEARACLKKLQ